MDSSANQPEAGGRRGRKIRLPCMRRTSKPSETQLSTSNGSDRAMELASRQDIIESTRLKKEKADLRSLRWMRRKKTCVRFWKRFVAFLLSTVGLTVAMVFYTIFGGFVFQLIEGPNEKLVRSDVKDSLQWHVAQLWKVTEEMNIFYRENWTFAAEEIIWNYTQRIVKATRVEGWDGKEIEATQQWSFAGSMLYAATVITTIGYGHIAPKTNIGRIATMLYALVGIPLTLLSITHLGGFMATVFRFVYKNIFCGVCCVLCRRRRWMDEALKTTVDRPPKEASEEGDGDEGQGVVAVSGGPSGVQERLRRPYTVIVQWRRGIRNALFTEDNLMVHVPLYVSVALIVGYITLGAVMFSCWEKEWDFLVGSYFCFITLSTIGFGDFVPGTSLDPSASQEKHVLCSLYLIFGLALLAMCFDLMQEEVRSIFKGVGRKVGLVGFEEQVAGFEKTTGAKDG